MDKPKSRIVNGVEVFNMEVRTDSKILTRPEKPKRGENQQGDKPPEGVDNEDAGAGTSTGSAAGNLVRVPCRVLSDGFTWSSTVYGPQLIDNGYNEAAALRGLASVLNVMRNRPVNFTWDHDNAITAKAGWMDRWAWEEANPTLPMPGGLNADIVVDPECDPKAALWLERGYINATSVSWHPDMVRSHPDMDIDTFLERMGEEEGGETICWRVIDCDPADVFHHAAVWAGADPFSGPRNQRTQGAGPQRGTGPEPEAVKLREGLQAELFNVARPGETSLSSTEILNRLVNQAVQGRAYVADLRKEATRWFDIANVDPSRLRMPEHLLRRRETINGLSDAQALRDIIAEYKPLGQSRFGAPKVSHRVTNGEEDLPPDPSTRAGLTGKEGLIRAGVASMFGRKKPGPDAA